MGVELNIPVIPVLLLLFTLTSKAQSTVFDVVAKSGPCKGPIELQVQGTVKAPADPSAFKKPDWVVFNKVEQFTMSGGGVFDGQGATIWGKGCSKSEY
ncbi:hypothetical protein REPUB_Repub12eG0027100 [Reevesia pubescens]